MNTYFGDPEINILTNQPINDMKLISVKTILGLSGLLLFACNNEDFNERGEVGNPSDYISFGVTPADGVQTKGVTRADVKEYVAGSFVLRSADSADTLCVRTIISDGIQGAAIGEKPITRGKPLNPGDEFYEAFHVLTIQDGSKTEFFMNDDVKKGTYTEGVWETDKTYYWPGKGELKFYAWAPIEGSFTSKPTSPAELKFGYTVPTNVEAQKDIVVAQTPCAGDFKQAVPLSFKHICTAVRFVVGAQMQPGTIQSISLNGVYNAGTYDMSGLSETSAGSWTLSSTGNFTQSLNKAMEGTEGQGDEITLVDGTFMMLPQTLPSDAEVVVEFLDGNTNTPRTLKASIAGSEWPMGKTVTYQLAITPEYELDFTSEPTLQDAHYVIYPIKIKAKEVPGGSWTMTSSSPEVTLRTDLTTLNQRGFWIEEDKGTESITSTATGDDITVYAFLTENATDGTREAVLTLRPSNMPDAKPATFTISQLCPSWNGNIGCERFEDGDYPWGFLWPKGMTVKYNMQNAGLGDLIKNALLNAYLSWFTDYGQFITKETWLLSITSVTINYDAVPQVAVAKDENNGMKNTLELYNFNGINDVSTLEDILKNWGGVPDKTLPLNPAEFAARSASMRNKYHKTVEQQGGQTIEVPVLPQDEITWYLPSRNEAMQMLDETYPLSGEYWTSTNSLEEHDNENAFKYSAGGSTSLGRRDVNLHVRAVRKR